MGYFLSTPTSRLMAAFHKLLKTQALSFFLCVWHLTIYFEYYIFGKAFKIENDGFGGF